MSYSSAITAVTVSLAATSGQNTGGSGTDTLSGFENVTGSASADRLTGSSGANVLNGGAGNDTLSGGLGLDQLIGGAGADYFDFNLSTETGNSELTADIILDFEQGIDRIDLEGIDASTVLKNNNTFQWNGTGAIGTSTAGELRYQWFDKAGTGDDYTIIYGDTNRDNTVEFQIRLAGLVTLSATDFIL